jgi:hypothetical protein
LGRKASMIPRSRARRGCAARYSHPVARRASSDGNLARAAAGRRWLGGDAPACALAPPKVSAVMVDPAGGGKRSQSPDKADRPDKPDKPAAWCDLLLGGTGGRRVTGYAIRRRRARK